MLTHSPIKTTLITSVLFTMTAHPASHAVQVLSTCKQLYTHTTSANLRTKIPHITAALYATDTTELYNMVDRNTTSISDKNEIAQIAVTRRVWPLLDTALKHGADPATLTNVPFLPIQELDQCLQILTAYNVSLNGSEYDDESPLHGSAHYMEFERMKALLKYGADATRQCFACGKTPAHIAIMHARFCPEGALLMLDIMKRIDPTVLSIGDFNNRIPLDYLKLWIKKTIECQKYDRSPIYTDPITLACHIHNVKKVMQELEQIA